MTERPSDWWRSAVVYQIYPRSFQDSDGDGVGDIPGIISRLDHIAALGVDVIWLSPVYRSPQDDNGYDIADYQDVDPTFGTLADLERLFDAVHERGMRIVMDLVVNHTSDEHPWFVASRSSREDPKRDWYWWRPPRAGHEGGTRGAEPTNWGSFFSGPAWQWDEATGEYYLHLFSRKQPDLNWENPEVRQAVYAMMRWWLDRGVDGFRMDVINLISKQVGPGGALPDGAAQHGGALGDGTPFFMNGPRIHEFLQEMNREVLAGRNLITVGETPGATVADAVLYTDPARGEVNMVFTFEHMELDSAPGGSKWDLKPLDLRDLKANLTAWQEGLAETGWNSLYWDNHDQPRIVSRWGDDGVHREVSAKALATVLHLLRGTPYVYQGEEFGMTNAHFASLEQYRDIGSLNWARDALAATSRRRWCCGRSPPSPVTTPAPPCSGTRVRTPASPPAPRGSRSTPTTPRSMPRPRWRTRTRCSTTTAGSSNCGTPCPWWCTATTASSPPTTSRSSRTCARSGGSGCWWWPTSPARTPPWTSATTPRCWAATSSSPLVRTAVVSASTAGPWRAAASPSPRGSRGWS